MRTNTSAVDSFLFHLTCWCQIRIEIGGKTQRSSQVMQSGTIKDSGRPFKCPQEHVLNKCTIIFQKIIETAYILNKFAQPQTRGFFVCSIPKIMRLGVDLRPKKKIEYQPEQGKPGEFSLPSRSLSRSLHCIWTACTPTLEHSHTPQIPACAPLHFRPHSIGVWQTESRQRCYGSSKSRSSSKKQPQGCRGHIFAGARVS